MSDAAPCANACCSNRVRCAENHRCCYPPWRRSRQPKSRCANAASCAATCSSECSSSSLCGPWGCFHTRSIVSCETDLITEPARVALSGDVVDAAADAEAAPLDRSLLPGPEFLALREHQDSEDARGVHALRSASLGTLVRRVTRGRMPQQVGLVLDLRRPPRRHQGRGLRRFEWSLSACASLVEVFRGCGRDVRVLVLAEEPEQFDVRGPAQLTDLLTLLAEAGMARPHALPPDLLDAVQSLIHCYWIPAGGYHRAPEVRVLTGPVTMITGEDE